MIKEDQGFFTNGPLTTPQNCRLRRDAISVIDCTNSFYFIGHIADGQVLAIWAGADLNDMEFVQFHPTDMVWPPSVKGTLTTEGEGDMLLNSEGKRFMFDNVPDMFKAEFSDTEDEANRWVNAIVFGKTPELLTRDVVAQAIRKEVYEGRRSPHGDVFLNIASRRSPENIKKKIPSMYHQSKELADVDITTNPIEVGPTYHYTTGGVRVDPESQETTVNGLFAAGEVGGGMHESNRLSDNPLSVLLLHGKQADECAAKCARKSQTLKNIDKEEVQRAATEAL